MDYPVLALLVAGFVLTLGDVASRYVLQMPLSFTSYEVVPLLIGLAAIFGAAIAERNGRGIRSPASAYLLGRSAGLLRLLQAPFSVGVYLITAISVYGVAQRSWQIREVSIGSGIPVYPFKFAIAAAFVLLAVSSFTGVLRRTRKGPPG